MRRDAVVLAAAIMLAPLGAQAADLVVWWERGFTVEEHNAIREVIAAFEQKTGKQVTVIDFAPDRAASKLDADVEAGRPPDFAFGPSLSTYLAKWALEDRLADLSEPIGHFADLFDPDGLDRATLLTRRPIERPCTACRWPARPTTSTSGGAFSSARA
jgi:ABC-type glycerol-3-phosphate transport system substrate-binding protein